MFGLVTWIRNLNNGHLRRQRLRILADHLEQNVEDEDFSFRGGWRMCAGGHAINIPEFQALGLKANTHTGAPTFTNGAPYYSDDNGFRVLEGFFHLSHRQMMHLFSDHSHDHTLTRLEYVKMLRKYT